MLFSKIKTKNNSNSNNKKLLPPFGSSHPQNFGESKRKRDLGSSPKYSGSQMKRLGQRTIMPTRYLLKVLLHPFRIVRVSRHSTIVLYRRTSTSIDTRMERGTLGLTWLLHFSMVKSCTLPAEKCKSFGTQYW